MDIHEEAVKVISSRVRYFSARKQPFRIYHGSTNSTRGSQRRPDNTVDTSSLSRVLAVDESNKTALVEPNVPMDVLVAATVAKGLVPLVVMEFPGITAGGGFSGTSGESSSFRYGPFDATVNWIEIVLPTGDVTKASRTTDEKTDLFWGAASAFGTLGVVTLLEVQLQDAKPYVQLTYVLKNTAETASSKVQKEISRFFYCLLLTTCSIKIPTLFLAQDTVDYVDAIMFTKEHTVVCSGRLTDNLPRGTKPQRFTGIQDPWFYIHVRRQLKQLCRSPDTEIVDYIPLVDYLFRYDRGGFWVAKYSFNYFLVPFNRVTRFLLNPFMHTRTMYRALHKSGLADFYMVQDVGVPYDKVSEFVDWLHDTLHIYPLWLCPLQLARSTENADYGLHSEFGRLDGSLPDSGIMNIGIWGPVPPKEFVQRNRQLEMKVQELGGKKWLYAHAYYTEDEFWAHYDRKSYDSVRAKYGAEWMPSVYDKVKVAMVDERQLQKWWPWLLALFWSIWPLRGLYGVFMAMVGGDYLMKAANQVQASKKD